MKDWYELGGTGEKYKVIENGKVFIFKPAVIRGTQISNTPRGYVQEAVYRVQRLIDSESAIFCEQRTIEGKFGALQEYVETSKDFNIRKWQLGGGKISFEHINQFMREFVIDWVCCNYDSHCGNFIVDKSGVIRGVDKEQAFKYIDMAETDHVSYTFHPNEIYGEYEPIYNVIFRRYRDGKLDIDFENVKKFVKKLAGYPDDKYMEIFEPYIKSIDPRGNKKIYDKILERKQNAPKEILSFCSNLKMIRKEEKPE